MLTRRAWVFGLVVLGAGVVASAGGLTFPWGAPPPGMPRTEKPNPAIEKLADYSATLHTNLGDLAVEFLPDDAPNAVRNFIKLAQRGFYDGSRFYCVFKDRMILAGDPTGSGTGDVGHTLPYEASAHGHTAGTLAMDRKPGGEKNSGSRFFINVAAAHQLDQDYTVFARIAKGADVAQRISAVRTVPNDGRPAPIEDIVIERVTVTRKSKEKEAEKASSKPGGEEKTQQP